MRTVPCNLVWERMRSLRNLLDTIYNKEKHVSLRYICNQEMTALEDAFTDFECAWEDHVKEYHEPLNKED